MDDKEFWGRSRTLATNSKRWWAVATNNDLHLRFEFFPAGVDVLDQMIVTRTTVDENHPRSTAALTALADCDHLEIIDRWTHTLEPTGSRLFRWQILARDVEDRPTYAAVASTCYAPARSQPEKRAALDGDHFPTAVVWASVDAPDLWTMTTGSADHWVDRAHHDAWLRMRDTLNRLTISHLLDWATDPSTR